MAYCFHILENRHAHCRNFAIEWIIGSYRIKPDKDSDINNDPNAWAKGKPRYILDLLLSVIDLSMKMLELVERLPRPELAE